MLPEKEIRRSFALSVANGALFRFASVFIDPNTVLALFIATATGSEALVGLIAALAAMGRVLPQMFVASRIASVDRKLRYYHMSFAVRAPALVSMVLVVAVLRDYPILVSALVLGLFAIYSFGGGFAFVPFMEVVGNTMHPSQRSTHFAMRSFTGLLLGILAGYVVQAVLSSPERYPYPKNYLLFFGLAAIFGILAMLAFSLVREPILEEKRPRPSLRDTTRQAGRIISEDPVYRRYLVARSLMALSALSTPFYVLHATINLGHGEAAAGVLIVSMTVGGAASYLGWGRMGDARGTRIVLLAGSALLASVPASALLAGLWRTLPTSMITFGILGTANAAIHIGVTSYLLDHAESQSRPVYVATTHIIVGVLGTSPFLGGIIAGRVGYAPLFTISFVLAACSVLFALRLPEPRGIAEKRFRTLVRLA